MFDLTPRADSLHVFANEYADALQNAAMLLGGAKWFQRAARFCDTLSDGGSISRRLLAEGASLRDLLALRFLDEVGQSPALQRYHWEFPQPTIQAEGSATFELNGQR